MREREIEWEREMDNTFSPLPAGDNGGFMEVGGGDQPLPCEREREWVIDMRGR